ncbi:hypothetical protein TorRG33x02_174520, partial [Trema orientale]
VQTRARMSQQGTNRGNKGLIGPTRDKSKQQGSNRGNEGLIKPTTHSDARGECFLDHEILFLEIVGKVRATNSLF